MTTNDANSLSRSYLQPTLNTLSSSQSSAKTQGSSTFAQMLQASSNYSPSGTSSKPTNPSQLLAQLTSSFQTTGLQNQAPVLNPLSFL